MTVILERPDEAVEVEDTRREGTLTGAVAPCFPCCAHCRRMKSDLAEALAERDRLRADARITAKLVARQEARDEGKPMTPLMGLPKLLRRMRVDALERLRKLRDEPQGWMAVVGLVAVAQACEAALGRIAALESIAGECVRAAAKGMLADLAAFVRERFDGAEEVAAMVEEWC